MCHVSCIIFGAKNLTKEEILGKDILEVGSYDVNGTLRPLIESWGPREYIGADIIHGPGVDIVCAAENIVDYFKDKKFDVVISTEMLEHVRDWQKTISNLKNICKPGGVLLLTTRSFGFAYHAYPHDYWRYEKKDMENIFADMNIIDIQEDVMAPGIFLKIKKPLDFKEKDLSNYELYSIVTNTKINKITDKDFDNYYFKKLKVKMKAQHGIYLLTKVTINTVKKALFLH